MYLFHNDYNQVCHPSILERLSKSQNEQMNGYGIDEHSQNAAALIKAHCGRDDIDVHFLVGGTQSNLIVITSALRPHQAVLSAETGHIFSHETGAIEATGHKVVTVPTFDGKLTAENIRAAARVQAEDQNAEHNVQIKMVYISNPTELGTTYSLEELEQIRSACVDSGFYLYLDGARLAYALGASDNDVTFNDYARLCDAFYIGGTKCGAMFGESVVICNQAIAKDFRYIIKQRGGMLAKGWLTGLQFETMFEKDLYVALGRRADAQADRIRQFLANRGVSFLIGGSTNQLFPILPNKVLDKLSDTFTFMIQQKLDDENTAVRFCTSWATTDESVEALCNALNTLL